MLEAIAKVLGMTVDEVAKIWNNNPQAMLNQVNQMVIQDIKNPKPVKAKPKAKKTKAKKAK